MPYFDNDAWSITSNPISVHKLPADEVHIHSWRLIIPSDGEEEQ